MLTIAPEAVEYIQQLGKPVFLELPKIITGCCFDFQECPSVRSGAPRDSGNYEKRFIQDVTVFVPVGLPEIPLVIKIRNILGIKSLIVDGWRYF
ncbi:MAG TPA: CC/Se motif family (seleno)protein [Dissulfurispiraceae bacterium]|nr:CC/Se motif family (seleno)protein [Dissulfurispiraceae bacterium]